MDPSARGRWIPLPLPLLLSFCACAAPAPSAEPAGSLLSVYLGQRTLDSDDWRPVEDQPTVGVEYARQPADGSLGFEVGVLASEEDGEVGGADLEGSTREIYLGARQAFGPDPDGPGYLGGGLAFVHAETEAFTGGGSADDDGSPGLYFHAGAAFDVTRSVSLGIDLRVLAFTDLEIAGIETDANYVQLALVLAFGF